MTHLMTPKDISLMRKKLKRQNREHTNEFVPVPESTWPKGGYFAEDHIKRVAVVRNNKFLVQIFGELTLTSEVSVRLSVNRTEMDDKGRWKDGITWDELYDIKNRLGFQKLDAVEVYPPVNDCVNVANMRHLWVLTKPLPFVWRRDK